LAKVPLDLFFYNRQALQAKLDEFRNAAPVDEDLVADLTEVVQFAEDEHTDTIANVESLTAANDITWELLWTIFAPNALIYRWHRFIEQDQVMKLRSIEKRERMDKSRYWEFSCVIVADDGAKFGFANEPFSLEMDEFTGTRKITDLNLYPLEYHSEKTQLRQDLVERGRRFAAISEQRVMQTSGPAIFEKRDANYRPHIDVFASHGRAVIDPAGFRSFQPNIAFVPNVHRRLARQELTDEELMICSPIALGFSFGDNRWGMYPT
jgi:hypothetical protein